MAGDDERVEEWLREARAAAARMLYDSVSGPRGRVVECPRLVRRGPLLACPDSWWRPRGVVAYLTVVEEPGVPVYRGPAWLEDAGEEGLLVASLDVASLSPRAPVRLLVHGYASPEELAEGVALEALGAHWHEEALCSGDTEAAARLAAEVLGALLLWRNALPAPPTWATEPGPWLRAARGAPGYEAPRVVLYVTPSWEPNTGLMPGMGAAPAAVVEAEPGPLVLLASEQPCRWLLRL